MSCFNPSLNKQSLKEVEVKALTKEQIPFLTYPFHIQYQEPGAASLSPLA
jgi:hypothetical protein